MLAGPMRQRTLSITLALLLLVTQQLGLLHLLSHLSLIHISEPTRPY